MVSYLSEVKQLIVLLVLIPSILSAQFSDEEQRKIDSLNAILAVPSNHDTLLVKAYVELSEIVAVTGLDTVVSLCEKAVKIARRGLNKSPKTKVKIALSTIQKHSNTTNRVSKFIEI